MTIGGRMGPVLLFAGDIAVFALSLWLTLFVRYGAAPSWNLFADHFGPFLILFAIWILIFFMSGLYEKGIIFFQKNLSDALLKTQFLNIVLAALFFFVIPYFGITPKTILAIYLGVSLALIFFWRLVVFPKLSRRRMRQEALLIGNGTEVDELFVEVNGNSRYPVHFERVIDPASPTYKEELGETLRNTQAELVVVDVENDSIQPFLPVIYGRAFVRKEIQFADFHQLYEEVFDRVPLSLLRYEWFLKNISHPTFGLHTLIKRILDIVGGVAMGLVVATILPLVFVAMRIEGKGPLFIKQERIGQHGTRMRAYKFRSMRRDKAASHEWTVEEKRDNPITRVGALLRRTSLDEFPQFINVLKGEISLIGPRNDIEGLGKRLGEEIPYYSVRYVVKPGITGWAQINQKYEPGNISPQSIKETRVRLAYDFYYIKNRSLILDLVIALKTIKRMLFRVSNI